MSNILREPEERDISRATNTAESAKVSYLPIVARGCRGDLVLHLVEVLSSDSGSAVMKKLRQRLADAKAFDSRFKRALRCQKPVVDIANVGLVSTAGVSDVPDAPLTSGIAAPDTHRAPVSFTSCQCRKPTSPRVVYSCASTARSLG